MELTFGFFKERLRGLFRKYWKVLLDSQVEGPQHRRVKIIKVSKTSESCSLVILTSLRILQESQILAKFLLKEPQNR